MMVLLRPADWDRDLHSDSESWLVPANSALPQWAPSPRLPLLLGLQRVSDVSLTRKRRVSCRLARVTGDAQIGVQQRLWVVG